MDAQQVYSVIQRAGQTCTLRRLEPAGSTPQTPTDVTVRAAVRLYKPTELIGDIVQGMREVRMTNIEISAANWPGPPRKNDKIVINGIAATIMFVDPHYFNDELLLFIMQVSSI